MNLSTSLLLGLIVISCGSYLFGQYFYLLNLFSHFQLQISAIIFLMSAHQIFIRKKIIGIISFIIAISGLVIISPINIVENNISNSDIYFQNVWIYNSEVNEIFEYLNIINPEVVALVELPDELENELSDRYNNKVAEGDGGQRCGIFSNRNFNVVKYDDLTYPVCAVQFSDYQLLVVHPAPPITDEYHVQQQRHFAEVSEILDTLVLQGEKFVLVGDFNAAGFSPDFRKYFGKYLKTNYYTWQPHKLWSIPIDHALSNIEIDVSRGPTIGSDHAGLQIVISNR